MTTDFEQLISLLARQQVEFVIIGGLAAIIHGAATVTYDVDICYRRSRANIEQLCAALAGVHPTLRDAPPGLPFHLDPPTVRAGLSFTLDSDLGPIDLLGEVVPFGGYEHLVPHTEQLQLFGHSVRVLTLQALILAKRRAGRPKDLQSLPELEALLALADDS